MNGLLQIKDTFQKLTEFQKALVTIILFLILYSVTSLAAYNLFSRFMGKTPTGGLVTSLPGPASVVEEDANEPKTETCPLNGALKSKRARDAWEKRRPLAVMIENHQESRPQSGLTNADVVYEAVAEGGITRFMAIYYCVLSDTQVGPVRSARTYYLDWLAEYDALYAHVGGANTPGPADALGQIIRYGVKDLNQFSIGFPVFWRDYQRLDHPVATEHTMYSSTQKLWEVGSKRGWEAKDEDNSGINWESSSKDFVMWKFKDDKPTGGTNVIRVPFWSNQTAYTVEWNYDATTNSYKRNNGGQPHMDLNNKRQVEPKNIVVQFQVERNAH
jgi:hypothetical protein